MVVCRGQKALAAEVLASIAARDAASGKVIERGTIVHRSALLGDSPLTHRIRFLLEMPIANLFDFLPAAGRFIACRPAGSATSALHRKT
jgi:hypothetical protein